MCDATFDIILLWSVTKKLREPHGKSNHITATRMMQFHVHQTSWSQRTKKPLAINFLKRGANSRPQSMDGIYSPLQILLFFVFFFHAPGHNMWRLTNCSFGCVRFWLWSSQRAECGGGLCAIIYRRTHFLITPALHTQHKVGGSSSSGSHSSSS